MVWGWMERRIPVTSSVYDSVLFNCNRWSLEVLCIPTALVLCWTAVLADIFAFIIHMR